MNEHVAGEVLAAYVDGTLPRAARQLAEAHLSRCRECREALAEVFAIGNGRAQVPPEFLERALPGKGALGTAAAPARNALPLRLAFGVAAVLLVALAVNYLFIGRGRADLPGKAQKAAPEPVVALEAGPPPAPGEPAAQARGAAEAPAPQAPSRVSPNRAAEKKRASAEAASGAAPAPAPVKSQAPADTALRRERLQAADETVTMPLREQEGGVIGGVLGGVEAPHEEDRPEAARLAAPAPGKDKGFLAQKAEMQAPRLFGDAAAGGAMQLFLAATGRVAAPRLLPAEAWSRVPPVRIAGGVAEEDLVAPRPAAAWDWLPVGAALEVTIAGDGSVLAVALLGEWDADAAARARAAAGRLLFSASSQETRRAILSRDPLN